MLPQRLRCGSKGNPQECYGKYEIWGRLLGCSQNGSAVGTCVSVKYRRREWMKLPTHVLCEVGLPIRSSEVIRSGEISASAASVAAATAFASDHVVKGWSPSEARLD